MQATWIRAAALAAACVCAGAAPFAQQPFGQQPAQRPAEPATAVAVGRVIDAATQQPLANVIVYFDDGSPARRNRPVITDSQGRFAFAGLARGRYRLTAQRSGYAQPFGATNRFVELAVGETITDLVVRMQRLAAISGTVTDQNGDPVANAGVIAYRRVYVNGQLMSVPSPGESRTDDRGAYQISNLSKGDYIVCACRRDALPLDGVLLTTLAADPLQLMGLASRALKVGADAASMEGVLTLAPTFYPSSTALSNATTIAIDGDDRTSIDIQMPVVRSSRVSGRVVGASGPVSANQVRMRLIGDAPEVAIAIEPMLVQPDGRFDFVGIPPGTYAVSANMVSAASTGPSGVALALLGGRGMSGPPPPPPPPVRLEPGQQFPPPPINPWGQAIVVVGDADLTDVIVPVQLLGEVAVKVETPASFTPNRQPIVRGVQLLPMRPDSRMPNLQAISRTEENGAFRVPNVAPGSYRLVVTAAPQLSVKSIRVAGREAIDQPIEVGSTPPSDIVVTLEEQRRATVSGSVTGHGDDGVTVLFFPTEQRLWSEPVAADRWFSSALVPRTGKFSTSLIAGEYFVVAVADEDAENWQARPRLGALAPRALKISVAAGETKSIEVKR